MLWKKRATKKLFQHPRLSIYEDTVELPSGKLVEYLHFGSAHDSVMVIAQNKNGKFLLQKEYSYPTNEKLFQFPGGGIEAGESPEAAAHRELQEEASHDGSLKQIGWYYTNHRRSNHRQFVYLATGIFSATRQADPEESFEDYWLAEKEIDDLIQSGEIINITTLSGWMLFKNKK